MGNYNCRRSSQAKGRIERLWRTFQDRLVVELEFYNITNFDEVNIFLKDTFIPAYNLQFSIEAEGPENAYRKNVFGDLDIIFCKKIRRKIMTRNIFSWESVSWILDEKKCFKGREININIHLNGSYSFDILGRKVTAKVLQRKKLNGNENVSKLLKKA